MHNHQLLSNLINPALPAVCVGYGVLLLFGSKEGVGGVKWTSEERNEEMDVRGSKRVMTEG